MDEIKSIIHLIIGFLVLIGCLIVGRILANIIPGLLSPSVLGMIIFFILLKTGLVNDKYVRKTSLFFVNNLVLFFLPPLVGIVLIDFNSIYEQLPSIIISAAISTILVMVVTGRLSEKYIENKN
ncbi:MAG: CidA/LrgA family protein [Bacteroidales bacterium]|jgi:holin-like protein